MRPISKFLFLTLLSSLCVAAMAAPNILGVWKGKINVDLAHLPPAMSPPQRQQLAQHLDQLKKLVITLVFKADHTYISKNSAVRTGGGGKWTLKGSTVLLSSVKKGVGDQILNLSSDHKTLSIQRSGLMVVFKRA